MAGIYIHIPFCRQACHYCNFHFSTSMKLKNGFLQALLKEIALQKYFLNGEIIETIYFGGGTPSLLSPDELGQICHAIRDNFPIDINAEITLEANPDDVTTENLVNWKQHGINRLSLGIQSFFDADLIWMNRSHSALKAELSILEAQKAGFTNLTIDLIFGNPGLSDENLHANVQKAISLNIPHLSCYALTVEPNTPLEQLVKRRKIAPVVQDDQARQFLSLMEWLQEAGYEQYEISNYSLPGKQSKHNCSYWEGKKYLGLGPSAHSYNGNARQWNVSNNAVYIQSLVNNTIPFEIEELTPVQKVNEWIMTSLRTKEGLQLNLTNNFLNENAIKILRRKTATYQERYYLKEDGNAFSLTKEGKLFADGIAASLFFEEGELI